MLGRKNGVVQLSVETILQSSDTRAGGWEINQSFCNRTVFFFAHFCFPASGHKPWSQLSSLLAPVLASHFYRAQGSAIALLVDFSSRVANSRSRAFRKSICTQEKVPTNSHEYALGGTRTHEADLFFSRIYFPASRQAVVTGVVPSPPRFWPSIFIAHRVQQFHCSSIFHRVLLTHALALSASQFVHKEKSPRIYTSMHSGGVRTHETDLYQARGQPDTPPGRPVSISHLEPVSLTILFRKLRSHVSDQVD